MSNKAEKEKELKEITNRAKFLEKALNPDNSFRDRSDYWETIDEYEDCIKQIDKLEKELGKN